MSNVQLVSSTEPSAEIENPATSQHKSHILDASASEIKSVPDVPYEVRFADGSTRDFELEDLRASIIAGEVRRTDEFRTNRAVDKWDTIDGLKNSSGFYFKVLYNPVEAHTIQGLTYGAIAGVVLKALDTLVLLGNTNPKLALCFLLIIGSLFVAKWISYAPIAAAVYTSFMLPGLNLWITLFAVAIVGAIFGGPLGALIGTIVGYFRKTGLKLAPDARQEGTSIYWWGIVAPIVTLAILVPLYVLWFMPMAISHLSK